MTRKAGVVALCALMFGITSCAHSAREDGYLHNVGPVGDSDSSSTTEATSSTTSSTSKGSRVSRPEELSEGLRRGPAAVGVALLVGPSADQVAAVNAATTYLVQNRRPFLIALSRGAGPELEAVAARMRLPNEQLPRLGEVLRDRREALVKHLSAEVFDLESLDGFCAALYTAIDADPGLAPYLAAFTATWSAESGPG